MGGRTSGFYLSLLLMAKVKVQGDACTYEQRGRSRSKYLVSSWSVTAERRGLTTLTYPESCPVLTCCLVRDCPPLQ